MAARPANDAVRARMAPAFRRFLDYWESLPAEGLVPRRRDIDPIALRDHLPDIILARFEDGERRLVLRLVGTGHVARWGSDLTGRNYLELIPEPVRPVAWARLRLIVDHPVGTHTFRLESYQSGRTVRMESLSLPLRGPDGPVNMMINFSREAERVVQPPSLLGPGQAFVDTLETRYIDLGAGAPRDPPL
jgi:hypothetical protein